MRYKSFDQLNGKTLKEGDEVVIFNSTHEVRTDHFYNIRHINNNVFILFGINSGELASEVYGYSNLGGCWPSCRHKDFEALTRIALVLLAFAEKRDVYVDMPDGTTKFFKMSKWCKKKIPIISEEFRVGGYRARFHNDKLIAGCQLIPFSQIENTYKLMLKHKKLLS